LIDALALIIGVTGATGDFFPFDLYPGGLENAASSGGNFGADAFTGDERNFVFHGGISL
jgi:hypothetical protein